MYTILHLVFGVLAVHGLTVQEAFQSVDDLTRCTNKSCRDEICSHLSVEELSSYPQVSQLTDANVSLHCIGRNVVMIKYNFGIYLIEQRTLEDAWNITMMGCGSFSTLSYLTPGTPYQYRLRELTKTGLAVPELSDWYTTYKIDYRPMEVKHIFPPKIGVDKKDLHKLNAKITFEPAEDRSCTYNVVSWFGEHDILNFDLKEPVDFSVDIKRLRYNENNILIISSSNGDTLTSKEKRLEFFTPSCLDIHHDLNICAPEKVIGLRVEAINLKGLLYDVVVNWDRPKQEPNNYTIMLNLLEDSNEPFSLTVPGNATDVSFSNIELKPQYKVSIFAESTGGVSPEASVVENIKKTSAIMLYHREIIITISTLLIIAVLLVGLYFQWCRQKDEQYNSQYSLFEEQATEVVQNIGKQIRDKFEIPPERLVVKNIIGNGAYGVVKFGLLKDDAGKIIDVAVKMLQDNPNPEDIKNFQREISLMKSAGQHMNIVSLIGHCNFYDKPMLIVEYCCKGDLQTYLRTIWENMVNILSDYKDRFRFDTVQRNSVGRNPHPFGKHEPFYQNVRMISNRLYEVQQECITAADLLSFARQVATGMEFLSSNRIIHRDLAARNVLVCADKIVKISDFGLSRDIYQENIYRKQGNSKLPLKWMAIEALTHQIYTTYSDIWSFGILLWEIVTLGATPYPGTPAGKILKLLKSGYRMEKPLNCGSDLYNIMYSCWNARPQNRPTFTELKQTLDMLLCNYSENKYINLCDIFEKPDDEHRLMP